MLQKVLEQKKRWLDFMDFADFFLRFSIFKSRQFLFLFHVFFFS